MWFLGKFWFYVNHWFLWTAGLSAPLLTRTLCIMSCVCGRNRGDKSNLEEERATSLFDMLCAYVLNNLRNAAFVFNKIVKSILFWGHSTTAYTKFDPKWSLFGLKSKILHTNWLLWRILFPDRSQTYIYYFIPGWPGSSLHANDHWIGSGNVGLCQHRRSSQHSFWWLQFRFWKIETWNCNHQKLCCELRRCRHKPTLLLPIQWSLACKLLPDHTC